MKLNIARQHLFSQYKCPLRKEETSARLIGDTKNLSQILTK